MPTGGFHNRERIVYSIIYELESPPPTKAELIVPPDSEDNSLNGLATSDPPGRPIVTVKPGEWIRFKGEPRLVLAVEVYRATGQI